MRRRGAPVRSEALTGGLARPCPFLSALVRILSFQLTASPCVYPWRLQKDREKRSQAQRQPPARPAPAVGRLLGGGERRPGPFGLFNAAPVGRRRPLPTEKRLLCPDITCRACGLARGAFSPPGLWSVTEAAQASPAGQNRGPSARTALCPGRALPWPLLCPGRCCLGWHTVRRRFSIPLRVCPACSSERGGSVPRAAAFGAG